MQAGRIQLAKPPQQVVDTTRRLIAEIRAGNLSGIEIRNGQVVELNQTSSQLDEELRKVTSVSGW